MNLDLKKSGEIHQSMIWCLLEVVTKALKRGKSAEGWAGIYDQEGNFLAEASTLLIDLPKETIDAASLAELGWKVYPD